MMSMRLGTSLSLGMRNTTHRVGGDLGDLSNENTAHTLTLRHCEDCLSLNRHRIPPAFNHFDSSVLSRGRHLRTRVNGPLARHDQ